MVVQSSRGNRDLIEAAKKGDVASVSCLMARSDVDKNNRDEVNQLAYL